MAKKSQRRVCFFALFLLGLAGSFLLLPGGEALADIAISGEIGGQTGVINPSNNLAISGEISGQTGSDLPGEGSFTTLPDDDGGGGGGGGSGGRRRQPAPPQILGASTCVYPYLQKYIRFGWSNDPVEVVKLQRFLNDFEGFNLAVTGIYDEPTLTAVMIFQRRYANDILEPWGLTAEQPTGFVFITTSLVINRLYCELSTAHDLDLRHVYDTYGPPAQLVAKEGGGREAASSTVLYSTTTWPEWPSVERQTAAAAVLEFLKDNSWFWLLPFLVLILAFAVYSLWREGPDHSPPEDYEEIEIDEDETAAAETAIDKSEDLE